MSYDALYESSPRYQTEDMLLPYFNQDNMFFNFPNSNVPHFQQLTKQTVDQFQFEASTRHTNKSSDNKFKKIKARVYKGLTRVINKRMKKIQKSTNYPKMAKFELFTTVPEIYANPNIKDNRIQINEPIKNLYSKCPISTAYKKYGEGDINNRNFD